MCHVQAGAGADGRKRHEPASYPLVMELQEAVNLRCGCRRLNPGVRAREVLQLPRTEAGSPQCTEPLPSLLQMEADGSYLLGI